MNRSNLTWMAVPTGAALLALVLVLVGLAVAGGGCGVQAGGAGC